jgi:hypothetical protein
MALDLELSTDHATLIKEIAFYRQKLQLDLKEIEKRQRHIEIVMRSINRRKRALYELGWKG